MMQQILAMNSQLVFKKFENYFWCSKIFDAFSNSPVK